ncbi:MAG: hypothetical protein LBJ67_02225 [Planctomycetaceae bacterium]|jgi:hypothetical protein|nr:hypothetical protein [Planctomycetaceae bacterium]
MFDNGFFCRECTNTTVFDYLAFGEFPFSVSDANIRVDDADSFVSHFQTSLHEKKFYRERLQS